MRNLFTRRRVAVAAAAAALVLGAGTALAYWTNGGSGTGSGSTGTSSATTVNEAAPVNADYSTGDGFLYPGTTQTVHLTVTNNGKGNQHVNQVTLTGWTSNKTGCDSTAHPGDFSMPAVTVNEDVAAAGTSGNHDGVITFNDSSSSSQDYCKSAAITFDYTAS